jgi:hypothetical protein
MQALQLPVAIEIPTLCTSIFVKNFLTEASSAAVMKNVLCHDFVE